MEKTTVNSERRQTNISLIDERGRTDEAIEKQTVSSESATDMMVESGRKSADQARLERRTVVDQENAESEGGSEVRHLLRERNAEDNAIVSERLAADVAFELERSGKKTELRKILDQVREMTDENLSKERGQNDFEARASSSLLVAEQSAHISTQAELTTREEFIAIVSHDLRNPIGAISSYSDLLLNDPAFIGIDAEVRRGIEFIKRNAHTSLRLISDILDMERIAEGKLGLQIGENKLSLLIEEAVENHAQLAKSRSIALTASPAMPPRTLAFDRDRIAQVLSNLIGNALKFTPNGGTVTIGLVDLGDEMQVSVTDTGPGIAENMKTHIFERFAQIHNKDRSGLGLGLYISKMFMEMHRGKLWVDSTLGQGCTFYFSLPRHF